jgi:hypothetical protein
LWLRRAHLEISELSELFSDILRTFTATCEEYGCTNGINAKIDRSTGDLNMKIRIQSLIIGLALLSALATAAFVPARAKGQERREGSESQARKLEGTWRVQVTLRNCQSGDALRTFPALLTFANGGTLTGTTTAFSPALRSPDHGVWEQTGRGAFSAVSDAFLFNPTGVWVSTQRITQAITIGGDPDGFESNAKVEFLDTNGNVTSTGCATAVGQRF